MKKIIKVFLLLLCVLSILSACTNRVVVDYLKMSWRNDKTSNHGYAAAFYNERIYYVSNESGDAGIYSMELDGSDVRIELKNPSITYLEVIKNKLYFAGLKEIAENVYDPWVAAKNKHSLYSFDLGDGQQREFNTRRGNTIRFFIPENDYKVITGGSISTSTSVYDNSFDRTDRTDDLVDRTEIIDKTTFSFRYRDEDVKKDLYQLGDMIIISMFLPEDFESSWFPDNSHPYVIDKNTGELVFKDATYTNQKTTLKAFYMDEKNIYCSYNDMVVVLDCLSFDVVSSFIPEGLDEEFNIEYMTKLNGDIYFVADKWRETAYKAPPLINEKLYKMNPDTFEYEELLDLNARKRILALDENYIILLDKEKIFKCDLIDGNIGDRQKLCDAPSQFYSKNHLVDIAGDWMFIYKIYPQIGSTVYEFELPGQQLLMKVNLKSGKVIRNDVKLDFSVLERYKQKK